MKKFQQNIFVFLILLSLASPSWVDAQIYPRTYEMFLELGKQALHDEDYEQALEHFQNAQLVYPESPAAKEYINLILRQQEKIIKEPKVEIETQPIIIEREKLIQREEPPDETNFAEDVQAEEKKSVVDPAKKVVEKIKALDEQVAAEKAQTTVPRNVIISPAKTEIIEESQTIYLDDELFSRQPKTLIRVELNQSLILEGSNIERHLVITEGIIELKRLSRNQVQIVALKRGSTFLHLWDDRGRWTFNVDVIMPVRKDAISIAKRAPEIYAQPFRFTYSSDWAQFYTGSSFDNVERDNLNYIQKMFIEGETPYGYFGSFVVFDKFDESTEVTGYGAGINDGTIGFMEDVTLRGFDTREAFSPLTLPGQNFRGVLFRSKLLDKTIGISYLHGKDRSTLGFLSSGVEQTRDSYVEGARVTFFPEQENQVSVNFARGYGDARQNFLKRRVYSIEGQRRFADVLASSEIAYDDQKIAKTFGGNYQWGERNNFIMNFRDIHDEFTTITSFPGNRGEIGASFASDINYDRTDVTSFLDLYQDKFLENEEKENSINLDFNTRVGHQITDHDQISTALFYANTPQEISPRENLRWINNYTHQFKIGSRNAAIFTGGTFQRARFDLTPSGEYDRYSLSTGMNIQVVQNLSYFMNYEFSWVDEIESGELLRPRVLNAGLNFAKEILKNVTASANLQYRDEENTEGNNSFLAGEDSVGAGLSLSYRPTADLELFVDGRARNVWAESNNRSPFNEVDIRMGLRSSWDLPFAFNPTGIIEGYVYKDLNNNEQRDENEAGIKDVKVFVGKEETVTNQNGKYYAKIKAKRAEVSVDVNSLPPGFVFTTAAVKNVIIKAHDRHRVDFGLTTDSGIYGIVYLDSNSSGKPDEGDVFVNRVELILDKKIKAESDSDGAFFFRGIAPGTHTLTIGVNSIPLEYLPAVKISTDVVVTEGTTYRYDVPLKHSPKK